MKARWAIRAKVADSRRPVQHDLDRHPSNAHCPPGTPSDGSWAMAARLCIALAFDPAGSFEFVLPVDGEFDVTLVSYDRPGQPGQYRPI